MIYVRDKYQIAPVYPWKMQPGYAVLCHKDTLKWFALLMNVEGSRIGLQPGREYEVINLRVPEEEVPELLRRKGFLPAYHMTAREWVTILLSEDTISIEELLQMLDRSYQLTRQPPEEKPGRNPGRPAPVRQTGKPVPGGIPVRQMPRRPVSREEGVIRFGRRYSDQPLSAGAWSREESLPPKIREMKTLARPGRGALEENIFYQQAMYMADYEDDFHYKGKFLRFYPTYQTMTSDQLRGYFGWRTRFRKGEAGLEQLPYIYLYLFEILCGAGIRSPEEGLEKLREVDRLFGEKDASLREKLRQWIRDYVVYHRLDQALLPAETDGISAPISVLLRFENSLREEAEAGHEESAEAAAALREEAGSLSEEEVFEALCRAAAYDLTTTAFYKKYPEETRQAAMYTLRELCLARKDRKMTLVKKYFGIPARYTYSMFSGAVFYDPRKQEDTVYSVNDALQYECADGRWYCRSFSRTKEKSRELGNLCHEIDRQLRIQYGFKSELKQRLEERASAEQIERAIREWHEWKIEEEKKAAAKPQLEIDFSLLSKIREDADQTRDKLIVEESEEFPEEPETAETQENSGQPETAETQENAEEPETPETQEKAEESETPEGAQNSEGLETLKEAAETEASADSLKEAAETEEPAESLPGLSPEHSVFVRLLLEGKDWRGYVAEHHLMLSLLVDEVNEAFYDEIGDTVLEFDGAEPVPVKEYEEELREYLG